MALSRLISPLLLLSLVVISSANPNSYDSYTKNPDTNDHYNKGHDDHDQGLPGLDLLGLDLLPGDNNNDDKSHGANNYYKKEEYKHQIPQGNSEYHHLPKTYQKPTSEGNPEYHVPKYNSLNDDKKIYDYRVHEGLSPYTHGIGVEGIVLCKSGTAYTPIQGARAIIKCQSSDASGYNYDNSYYVTSSETDKKGCFVATLSMEELAERSINLKECKAYLEYSPIQTCTVAANDGAYLSPSRNVGDESYYNVGSLVYTTEEPRHYVNNVEPTVLPKDYPSVQQPHY